MSRDFIAGFALALADINRLHDCPTYVADTIVGAGFTIADFRQAGVEEYDLAELRKCVEEGGGSAERQARIMGPSHRKSRG
ncbi:hypothetical protein V5F49_11095 [Xanthobacter sp. V3C-3]|uniref:hypothetical protein n=1 Tax=Xanthobacter lutulentifluminis TaxID=3119935 RepID=UPI00372BFBBF